MGRKPGVLALVLLLSTTAFGEEKSRCALRDGIALSGFDGRLTRPEEDDIWFFEFESDVNDDRCKIAAGTAIEVLPSSALEKAASTIADKCAGGEYRVWGRLTKYRGKNYMFGIYFLPVSQAEKTAPEAEPREGKETAVDPNDPLTLPPEIMEKLKARKIVRPEQLREGLQVEQDMILADRTGFIVSKEGHRFPFDFEFDAVGRNIEPLSIHLLPCQSLEKAWQVQDGELEPARFKIGAVLTSYKGECYLLAQKATRVYSYGNFPR